jgi:acetolactate synthase-1/2/3 large subunit
VSHWVHESRSARDVAADAARAVQAARVAPGQIASLILPADTAWNDAERSYPALPVDGPAKIGDMAIKQAAAALCAGGKVAFLLRGEALRGRGLAAAGRIATATGARLLCDTFAPRIERGAGRPIVERMPYRPAPAIEFLTGTETLILVGTQAPVGATKAANVAPLRRPDMPANGAPLSNEAVIRIVETRSSSTRA